jgi:hypothetical protein
MGPTNLCAIAMALAASSCGSTVVLVSDEGPAAPPPLEHPQRLDYDEARSVWALTYGSAVSARSGMGTGTGMSASVMYGTHLFYNDYNLGVRFEKIAFDDDTLSRVTVGAFMLEPANDYCGVIFGGGYTYHWSEQDANGAGMQVHVGFYAGHVDRFIVTACCGAAGSLGSDAEGFDAAAEATAFIEATVMF